MRPRISVFQLREDKPIARAILGLIFLAFLLAALLPWAMVGWFLPGWWHAHEALFGVPAALICGFLLIALPNWLGFAPPRRLVTMTLLGLWLLGRVAVLCAALTDTPIWVFADCASLTLLAGWSMILTMRSHRVRTRKIAWLVAALALAKCIFSFELTVLASPYVSLRIATAVLVLLPIIILGRMIPVFTQEAFDKLGLSVEIARQGHADIVVLATTLIALLAWVVAPVNWVAAVLAGVAALFHLGRLLRWRGQLLPWQPLLHALHLAYAFVPLGFGLIMASTFWSHIAFPSVPIHAWLGGTMMIAGLAIVSRILQGHGNGCRGAMRAQMFCVPILAAGTLLRLAADVLPDAASILLLVSASLWSASLLVYCLSALPDFKWGESR